MSTNRMRRHSSLLTLAGAAVSMPASAAVISHTLSTPLTIGGMETIGTSPVSEAIWFNPLTNDIALVRGETSATLPLTSGLIGLEARTRVAGDTKPVMAVAAGMNTRFMALGNYSAGTTSAMDEAMSFLPERLDAGRSIGATSNWGLYKPMNFDTTVAQAGSGMLIGPDVLDPSKESLPVQNSQLWGSGARGSIGFAMDAFAPTGNMMNGPNKTDPSTWADPNVPEYVQVPESVPSFDDAIFGWAEIGMGASGTTLYSYAYDDSGAPITTLAAGRSMDVSAVPEPANVLTLASLLGGSLLLRSRRRAPASVADA